MKDIQGHPNFNAPMRVKRWGVAMGMQTTIERDTISKQFMNEMFGQNDGHNIKFAFDVSIPNNVWRVLGIDELRAIAWFKIAIQFFVD